MRERIRDVTGRWILVRTSTEHDQVSVSVSPYSVTLPAQAVDATPSDQLIRQHFSCATDRLLVLGQNLARVAFRLI
jgi:hypothetical protein